MKIRTFRFWARTALWVLVAASFLAIPRSAPASFPIANAGGTVRWSASSPSSIWNDSTKTLTWAFYNGNFLPSTPTNWPSLSQAGAAFQNAFQSHQDVVGRDFTVVRAPDTATVPAINDGNLTMAFVLDQTSDFYGTNITGFLGITYLQYNTSGVIEDADVFINGDPSVFTWSVDGSAPLDVQSTATHETMHVLGSGHSIYLGSRVFPVELLPGSLLQDRVVTPDDRGFFRTIYPGAAGQGGTLTGVVGLLGGGQADRAVVVATDAAGVPQGVTATDGSGTYFLNVPAGTYTVTAFHGTDSWYIQSNPSDVDFTTASPFATASVSTGQVVTNGAFTTVNPAIVANNPAGISPSMKMVAGSVRPAPVNTQILFLNPGTSGTARLVIDNNPNATITAGEITGVTLGSGQAGDIVVTGAPTTVLGNPGFAAIDIPYTVPAAAIPGFRNLSVTLNVNGNERLFLPGVVKVTGAGGLAASASAVGNPPTASLAFGAVNAPLLRLHLQANAAVATSNEDVRLHKLVFTIAGNGPTLSAARLWVDQGTAGIVDAADTRVFTGAAYQNSPLSETIPATPPGTLTFNDLALTVPAGGGVDLLLTADVPGSGLGDYIASFNPAGQTGDGMFWGDSIACTGGLVSGGTESLGVLSIGGLQQKRTTAGTLIPVGGSTTETQVTLMGIASTFAGTVGMEVEAKPVGVAFDGIGTTSSATTFASGATISVNVTGLTNFMGYHWRARATSPTLAPSVWSSFGSNAESAIDFACDNSTTNPPSGLAQVEADGTTPVPLGGSIHAVIILEGQTGTNSGGLPVSLQFEVKPAGTAFTNVPNLGSPQVIGGTLTSGSFSGATGDYHWQASTVSSLGAASTWVSFDPAALHFHLEAPVIISAKAGCTGAIGGEAPGGATLGAILAAALFLFVLPRQRSRLPGSWLLVFLVLASPVLACQDIRLPRSLMDGSPAAGSLLREGTLPTGEPAASAPGINRSPFSADAYLGALFQDMKFSATGTDLIERQVKGTGAVAIGVEGFYAIVPDWRVGLVLEGDLWGDVQVFGGGIVGSWRFSAPRGLGAQGAPETEHILMLAVLFEDLQVSKANFGSFNSTIGIRAGYEFRYALGGNFSVAVGAALQYAQWKYSPAVLSGDTQIGGFGGLLNVGIAYQF